MEKNNQLLEIIKEIADAREVTEDVVIASLETAMKKAYEKEMSSVDETHEAYAGEKCEVNIDKETGKISLYRVYTVIDDATTPDYVDPDTGVKEKEYNDYNQKLLSEAKKIDKNAVVGGTVKEYVDINALPKRVVTHMLLVFKQGVSIESNKNIYKEWAPKIGTIVYAEVEKIDAKSKLIQVNLGKTYGVVRRLDANPDEKLIPGAKYKFVIKDVKEQTRGWPVELSRASGLIVSDLLHTNIPEIQSGVVEIKKVGRVAGYKTKVAVKSNQPGIDAIGACIGARADRIRPILQEMGSEKIEFANFDEEMGKFIVNICNPVPVYGYHIDEPVFEEDPETGKKKEISGRKITLVTSDDYRVALLIGLKGKNVKILSQLLEADIDVISVETAKEENVEYVKVERIVTPTAVDATKKEKPVNKFSSTLDKYKGSTADILESINKTNEVVSDATKATKVEEVVEEVIDEAPVEISNEELSSYADDLAALDELTKDVKKK